MIALKGQSHKICYFDFYYKTASSGPISDVHGHDFKFDRFFMELFEFEIDSLVSWLKVL